MRALWLEDRRLRLRGDLAPPRPAPGEALVRVVLAGICNTDIELTRGYYPFTGIPGHEFVGRVEAAASAPQLVGRRVVGEINAACERCEQCRAGRETHCDDRTVLGIRGRNGAFAEFLTLPVRNLHLVPDAVADDEAVFTEPVAAAFEILTQVEVGPRQRVTVIGDGKLGQLVAQVLASTGCRLQVAGRHEAKLARLAALGLPVCHASVLEPRRADLVVECTGNPDGLALARQAVRPRGTIVLKSTYTGAIAVDMSGIVVDEVTLIGSRCGPFAPALAALADGRVVVRPLIDARLPLAQAVEGFRLATEPGVLKVLVEP